MAGPGVPAHATEAGAKTAAGELATVGGGPAGGPGGGGGGGCGPPAFISMVTFQPRCPPEGHGVPPGRVGAAGNPPGGTGGGAGRADGSGIPARALATASAASCAC